MLGWGSWTTVAAPPGWQTNEPRVEDERTELAEERAHRTKTRARARLSELRVEQLPGRAVLAEPAVGVSSPHCTSIDCGLLSV